MELVLDITGTPVSIESLNIEPGSGFVVTPFVSSGSTGQFISEQVGNVVGVYMDQVVRVTLDGNGNSYPCVILSQDPKNITYQIPDIPIGNYLLNVSSRSKTAIDKLAIQIVSFIDYIPGDGNTNFINATEGTLPTDPKVETDVGRAFTTSFISNNAGVSVDHKILASHDFEFTAIYNKMPATFPLICLRELLGATHDVITDNLYGLGVFGDNDLGIWFIDNAFVSLQFGFTSSQIIMMIKRTGDLVEYFLDGLLIYSDIRPALDLYPDINLRATDNVTNINLREFT